MENREIVELAKIDKKLWQIATFGLLSIVIIGLLVLGFFANKKDARRVYEWLVEQYKKDKKPIDFTKPRNIGRTLPRPSFIRALEFLADEPRNVRKQTA